MTRHISSGMVLAFVLVWISQKLRFSSLVGYLLAGIVIAPFAPVFIGDQELAHSMAEMVFNNPSLITTNNTSMRIDKDDFQ